MIAADFLKAIHRTKRERGEEGEKDKERSAASQIRHFFFFFFSLSNILGHISFSKFPVYLRFFFFLSFFLSSSFFFQENAESNKRNNEAIRWGWTRYVIRTIFSPNFSPSISFQKFILFQLSFVQIVGIVPQEIIIWRYKSFNIFSNKSFLKK